MPKKKAEKRLRTTLFLVEKCWEFVDKKHIKWIPSKSKGIYALLRQHKKEDSYDVMYVGMARGSNVDIPFRLRSHRRSKSKGEKWSHFSAFKVWDNIPPLVVAELEGILREIYRKDRRANELNIQKRHKPLQLVRVRRFK